MSILHDPNRLRQAAAALAEIDEAGRLRDLGDAIMSARREHRQREHERTIGDGLRADQLATVLHRTTGIPWRQCRAAVADAISPEWSSIAMKEIIAFAGEQSAEVWR